LGATGGAKMMGWPKSERCDWSRKIPTGFSERCPMNFGPLTTQ